MKDDIILDSRKLGNEIRNMVAELIGPIETAQESSWEAEGDPPTGLDTIYLDLNYLAAQFALADGELSENEAFLFRKIGEFLGKASASWQYNSYNALRASYPRYKAMRVPFCVQYLDAYDAGYGTNYADKAKAMFFRFANAMAKADGEITEEEKFALLEFKKLLYPSLSGETPVETSANTRRKNLGTVKEERARSLDALLDDLNSLVGLDGVKNDVLQLVNFLNIQQIRQMKGMPKVPISRHLVFYGNPGTGKTTVARLLSQIYKSLKILRNGHLVETDRTGLVAGYVGQTALKVREVAGRALGGILFIDEAYALMAEGQDYGREAIDTLVKLMEDNRDDLIVVVAGYTNKMNKFLLSNPEVQIAV
jgi:SpoVK/Ycf46/Vps4 family AAA+-type ATPase